MCSRMIVALTSAAYFRKPSPGVSGGGFVFSNILFIITMPIHLRIGSKVGAFVPSSFGSQTLRL
jgi:hypothetical protein